MWKKLLKKALLISLLINVTPILAEEEETDTYSCRLIDFYDYYSPVPWGDYVDDSYYDTAFFGGDSRMGSLYLYGDIENGDIHYVTSLNLLYIDMMKVDDIEDEDSEVTLYQLLNETRKENVYLLFGINEIRNKDFTAFAEMYQEIITMLRNNNPNVNIYIILAYHPDYISNLPEPTLSEHLVNLNTTLMELAIRNYVFYLNLDNGMNDEEGTIIDDYVADGLHFTYQGTQAFKDYIATHVVRREVYVKEICE